MSYSTRQLASVIDHTLLKPGAVSREIRQLCLEAAQYGFASVCVHPCFVRLAVEMLAGKEPAVCTVAGFPLGANTPEVKVQEAEIALDQGASEIDMVINLGLIKSGEWDLAGREIQRLSKLCRRFGAHLKVIIETGLLTPQEIEVTSRLVADNGGNFVKTSTGFGPRGASVEDIRIIGKALGEVAVGIKASGGIRTREDALAMIEAGATRIGTSAGVTIVTE